MASDRPQGRAAPVPPPAGVNETGGGPAFPGDPPTGASAHATGPANDDRDAAGTGDRDGLGHRPGTVHEDADSGHAWGADPASPPTGLSGARAVVGPSRGARLGLTLGLALGLTGAAVLAALLLAAGGSVVPAWPGAWDAPAWWPTARHLDQLHAWGGLALTVGTGLALGLAAWRARGWRRALAGLGLVPVLLLGASGWLLGGGGWLGAGIRDGGLPAGTDPALAAWLVDATVELHEAMAATLPALLAAWAAWTLLRLLGTAPWRRLGHALLGLGRRGVALADRRLASR